VMRGGYGWHGFDAIYCHCITNFVAGHGLCVYIYICMYVCMYVCDCDRVRFERQGGRVGT
jgi:hypothetical protein